MTNDTPARARARSTVTAFVVALAALLLAGPALAQSDDIAFDVEIFRVDLVRGDDGEITDRFVPVEEAIPGEVIEYRVTARNDGDIIFRPGTVVVTLPIGDGVAYVEGSATPSSDEVVTEFSADGGETFSEPPVLVTADGDESAAAPEAYDVIRWTLQVPFEPGEERTFVYRVEVR